MRAMLLTVLLSTCLANPLAAENLTGTLLQIQKSGKIRVGYRDS